MSQIKAKSATAKKRFLNDQRIEDEYGINRTKLRKMRLFGIGPEFRRFGHRTVLYDVDKLEQWIASLPKGGGAAA